MADPGRPGYHFTVPTGWINDPLGVTWHEPPAGGRYELFYQSNPDAPVWTPACRWGQATSTDLVRWSDPRTALEPRPGEGCWSGSVAVDRGRPVLVYTSVAVDAPDRGSIALAWGDAEWRHWAADPGDPVVPAPGADQGYAHVRDPYVWRDGGQWRMVVGGGTTDRRPVVLQYSSDDLRTWRPDGVLAGQEPGADGPGGAAWECPQLFPLDGAWVLLVSVWDGEPGHVAAAVGDYDGRRFTARRWQRLADDACYAPTAFADADGRRCALTWVRDVAGPEWSGALTVPWLLGRDGDRLTVAPHPDVDGLRTDVRADLAPAVLSAGSPVPVPVGRHADVRLRADLGEGPFDVALQDSAGRMLTLTTGPGGPVRISAPGQEEIRLPVFSGPGAPLDLRLLVDTGLVEVFSGGEVAVARLPEPDGDPSLSVEGDGVRLGQLVVHGMERLSG